jgi:S-formylglutathione hydrolase FrmB
VNKVFIILVCSIILSCSAEQKRIDNIESNFLENPSPTLIVKPSSYSDEKEYPLVIIFHGWSGDYLQWNSIIDLEDLSNAYNFIIACPDGFYDSWYLNHSNSDSTQYEDFFIRDFIPYLTNNYSIDTNSIFITGLSMGGHGAITLFLKYPSLFKSAASSSGILDITKFPANWGIKNKLGGYKENIDVWNNHSAYFLLDNAADIGKNLFIDCGTEDFAYEVNLNFVKKCMDLGIKAKFISVPGDHSRTHWKRMLPKHFEFFNGQLEQ